MKKLLMVFLYENTMKGSDENQTWHMEFKTIWGWRGITCRIGNGQGQKL